jgi:hypothetical protein
MVSVRESRLLDVRKAKFPGRCEAKPSSKVRNGQAGLLPMGRFLVCCLAHCGMSSPFGEESPRVFGADITHRQQREKVRPSNLRRRFVMAKRNLAELPALSLKEGFSHG